MGSEIYRKQFQFIKGVDDLQGLVARRYSFADFIELRARYMNIKQKNVTTCLPWQEEWLK